MSTSVEENLLLCIEDLLPTIFMLEVGVKGVTQIGLHLGTLV